MRFDRCLLETIEEHDKRAIKGEEVAISRRAVSTGASVRIATASGKSSPSGHASSSDAREREERAHLDLTGHFISEQQEHVINALYFLRVKFETWKPIAKLLHFEEASARTWHSGWRRSSGSGSMTFSPGNGPSPACAPGAGTRTCGTHAPKAENAASHSPLTTDIEKRSRVATATSWPINANIFMIPFLSILIDLTFCLAHANSRAQNARRGKGTVRAARDGGALTAGRTGSGGTLLSDGWRVHLSKQGVWK